MPAHRERESEAIPAHGPAQTDSSKSQIIAYRAVINTGGHSNMKGKKCIVTGGASGIGKKIAHD